MLFAIIIIAVLVVTIAIMAHEGQRPPNEMTRHQIYQSFLKEKEIAECQLNRIKTLQNELECSKKQTGDLMRSIHQEAEILSRQKVSEAEKLCGNRIVEFQKKCDAKISEITARNTFLEQAYRKRADAEPWMANYLAHLETAEQLNAVQHCERRAPVTARRLEERILDEFRPSIAENKMLKQRLDEYESLFPTISEYTEDLKDQNESVSDDGGRSWLSDEEFLSKTDAEKNQLILDRYLEGHRKSKWQIGRDYELYIGHVFHLKEYTGIIQHGIEKKLEDLGIDIIANNPKTGRTAYIQCKNWSQSRQIRENTVTQLYAGALIHALHNNQSPALIDFHICTSTTASELAKKCATILGVHIHENIPLGKYPAIKCKAGTDQNGLYTRIYHLPIDQMYDRTYIAGENDFYAWTIEEAESRDFRRAFRWRGGDGIQ